MSSHHPNALLSRIPHGFWAKFRLPSLATHRALCTLQLPHVPADALHSSSTDTLSPPHLCTSLYLPSPFCGMSRPLPFPACWNFTHYSHVSSMVPFLAKPSLTPVRGDSYLFITGLQDTSHNAAAIYLWGCLPNPAVNTWRGEMGFYSLLYFQCSTWCLLVHSSHLL